MSGALFEARSSSDGGCSSVFQSESSLAPMPLGARHHEEGGANQKSDYCKDLLLRDGAEFTFEELRAERYFQQREQQQNERLRQLKEVEEKLLLELQEKTKLLKHLKASQPQVPHESSAPRICDHARPATSFQVYEESQSAPALPSGNSEASTNQLPDEVFLQPDEAGLCMRVCYPRAGGAGPADRSKAAVPPNKDVIQSGPGNTEGTTEDLQAVQESRPHAAAQTPAARRKLSPIQETSVEANTAASLCTSARGYSPLLEDQDREEDCCPLPAGGSMDPCDPDLHRRQLLDLCDITSSPDLHSEPGLLPTVEEDGALLLGGELYLVYSMILGGGAFSVYRGTTEEEYVIIRVDSSPLPWDFHLLRRLREDSPAAASLPLISCFLFQNGCVTVYRAPSQHTFTELTTCDGGKAAVDTAISLLQLVTQLHSCRLVHAALQPRLLACSRSRRIPSPSWMFPVDWSSAVDLDLQRDVTSVQQLPSAQTYISLGLLDPNAPPQLLDLVGVAETLHLLLTNSSMVVVRDSDGWMAERFSGDQPSDVTSRTWRSFFRLLLNAGATSWPSVLAELMQLMSTLST